MVNTLDALQAFGMGQQARMTRALQDRQVRAWEREDSAQAALSEYAVDRIRGSRQAAPLPSASTSAFKIGNNPTSLRGAPAPGEAAWQTPQPAVAQPTQMPGVAMPQPQNGPQALLSLGQSAQQRSSPLERVAQADPRLALELSANERKTRADEIAQGREFLQWSMNVLGNATDEASYQVALDTLDEQAKQFGQSARDFVPPTYPGPDGMRLIRERALSAEQQLQAEDRRLRLDWDLEDGRADNARQERDTASQINYRSGQLRLSDERNDISREGHSVTRENNIRSTTTSRENNVRSTRQSDVNSRRSAETSRGSASYQGRGGRGGRAPVAQDAQGNKITWDASKKQWVPVR